MIGIVRVGWRRGLIELRQSFTNGADIWAHFFWPLLTVGALWFLRDRVYGSSGLLLGALALPSVLGMNAALGMVAMSQQLTADREDGTLLRAKATPNGMLGYLVGKITVVSGMMLISLTLQLGPGLFVLDGLALNTAGAWFTLAWVLLLGMVATMPLGAIVGSLFSNPRNFGLVMLPLMGLIATSGIFYPITNYPVWLQWLGQVFPIYWLGLGMRSALLPDQMAAVEFDQSWRHLETFGMLSLWAVAGLVIAPIVLRRMARRESGSSVAARREKALQRVV
jgi:ABC-2 type transport system permease protein